MAATQFKIWRQDGAEGEGGYRDYATEVTEGMVVLDAVHQIQAESANDLAVRWNCKAGKCGSCSAEVNGTPRLMCMTRMSDLPTDRPVTVEPMRAFPVIRDLVCDVSWNYEVKKKIQPFEPRPPDAEDGTWRIAQEDVERVQEFRKCIECFLCQDVCTRAPGPPPARRVRRPALLRLQRRRSRCTPLDTGNRLVGAQARRGHRLLQHHKVLHEGLPGAHHDHRQRDHPAQGAGGDGGSTTR